MKFHGTTQQCHKGIVLGQTLSSVTCKQYFEINYSYTPQFFPNPSEEYLNVFNIPNVPLPSQNASDVNRKRGLECRRKWK